jgi:hypothetical protein
VIVVTFFIFILITLASVLPEKIDGLHISRNISLASTLH